MSDEGWMQREYEAARQRNASLPPHARLIITAATTEGQLMDDQRTTPDDTERGGRLAFDLAHRCKCSRSKGTHTYNAALCPTNRWMHPR